MTPAPGSTVYVCGPMRGVKLYNFPAFDEARNRLNGAGFVAVSPADLDRKAGFDPEKLPPNWKWDWLPPDLDLNEMAARDTAAIMRCDAVVLLPGWERSEGVAAEIAVARWLKKQRLDLETFAPIAWTEGETVLQEAQRLCDGDRQYDYGHPAEEHAVVADLWSGYTGAMITARDVAHMMILLKIVRNKHNGKRDNWTDMAGYAYCGHRIDAHGETNA